MTRQTPVTRRERLGNPSGRRLTVLPGGSGFPALPDESLVPLKARGRAAWDLLRGAPWIRATDEMISTMFCQAVDEREALKVAIGAELVVPGSKGQPVAHPLLDRLAVVERNLLEMGRLLLLDPRQRAELGVAEVKAQSKLEELRARRAARSVTERSS